MTSTKTRLMEILKQRNEKMAEIDKKFELLEDEKLKIHDEAEKDVNALNCQFYTIKTKLHGKYPGGPYGIFTSVDETKDVLRIAEEKNQNKNITFDVVERKKNGIHLLYHLEYSNEQLADFLISNAMQDRNISKQ